MKDQLAKAAYFLAGLIMLAWTKYKFQTVLALACLASFVAGALVF